MVIIIEGDPIEGFRFTGPFEDEEQAMEYSETNSLETDWWIADLTDANDPEGILS